MGKITPVPEHIKAQRLKMWRDLVYPIRTLVESYADYVYSIIEEQYSESYRFYHNFEHIEYGLMMSQEFEGDLALNLAWWFHDIIYKVGDKLNEEKSSTLFKGLGLVPKNISDECVKLILATKHDGKHDKNCEKSALIIDTDLMLFRSEDYLKFAQLIKREHLTKFTHTEYNVGRLAFLRNMLSRESIYLTPSARHLFEKCARINIENEIRLIEEEVEIEHSGT